MTARSTTKWIADSSLSGTADEPPAAEFDSLADLVNFAIDSGIGVVADGSGTYHVNTDSRRFVYHAPAPISGPVADDGDTTDDTDLPSAEGFGDRSREAGGNDSSDGHGTADSDGADGADRANGRHPEE